MVNVAVIGGGLVGPLCAIYMARRGYQVTLFEYREDVRKTRVANGRSINLAISNRGRRALSEVGLESMILEKATPMRGRLLHFKNGNTKSVLYDPVYNQCIYSVRRHDLHKSLLTALEGYPNVKIHFNHKLIAANFNNDSITVTNTTTQQVSIYHPDLIVGADGAHSTLRRFMQQVPLFEYSQTYIKHGYVELSVDSKRGAKMTPNHLHIWPRGDFMLIGLPNQDSSWVLTLFMPFDTFNKLSMGKNDGKVLHFFKNEFRDALDLIGEEVLVRDFFKSQPSSLISVKTSPFSLNGKFLLIGDAAHAMVPFYGQGVNAGFEDCLILDRILDSSGDFSAALMEFNHVRKIDAFAICDLAMYNYKEMRDLVTRRSYFLRKKIDELLYTLFPSFWVPLYNSVTFSNMPYTECVKNREWQNTIIQRVVIFTLLLITFIVILIIKLK